MTTNTIAHTTIDGSGPVFVVWRQTADGVWEAQSFDTGDQPGFDAVAWCTRSDTTSGAPAWSWDLYRHLDSGRPFAAGSGTAATLTDAQRQAETRARRWLTEPDAVAAEDRLARFTSCSVLACDRCGAYASVNSILTTWGCITCNTAEGDQGGAVTFEGYDLDDLADALV